MINQIITKKILTIVILIITTFLLVTTPVSSQPMNWKKGEANEFLKMIEKSYLLIHNEKSIITSDAGLEEYLSFAANNNPGLKAAFYQWKAALEKSGYAGSLPDPMFSYGYFVENVETRVGPQKQRFSLKQSIPWFGTLGAKENIAFQSSNMAFQNYQSKKLKLFYRVKSAFYDYYFLGREIKITQENMELLLFWESVARTKYKVALKQHPDVIKAQVELGKLEDRLLTLRDKIRPLEARLKAVLNLNDTTRLSIPLSIKIDEIEVNHDLILEQTLTRNPDLSAIQHLIEKENAGMRLAGKSSYPNFTLGVDYVETGEAVNPLLDESGKDPWMVSVNINLPIWFGKNKSKKNEAKARYLMAEQNLSEAQNQITALTEKILFEYDDALRKLRLYRDGLIPKAEQSLNASYTAYQAGEADFLNVLDAQRVLLNFQLSFDRAKTNLAKKKAELEMLTGYELGIS
ncbi:MAG: TolC family protein [Candidatus Zixiibacteriota bacterium]